MLYNSINRNKATPISPTATVARITDTDIVPVLFLSAYTKIAITKFSKYAGTQLKTT